MKTPLLCLLTLWGLGSSVSAQTILTLHLRPEDRVKTVNIRDSWDSIYTYEEPDTLIRLEVPDRGIELFGVSLFLDDEKYNVIYLMTAPGKNEFRLMQNAEKNITMEKILAPAYEWEEKISKKILPPPGEPQDTLNISLAIEQYLRTERPDYFSLQLINYYVSINQNDKVSLARLKPYLERFPENYRASNAIYLATKEELEGKLEQFRLDLSEQSLLDLRLDAAYPMIGESITIVDIWNTRCPPCLKDHQQIEKDYARMKKNKIELISISNDLEYVSWQNYLNQHRFSWPHFILNTSVPLEERLVEKMKIKTFPSYLIVDNRLNILASFNSFESVKRYLRLQ